MWFRTSREAAGKVRPRPPAHRPRIESLEDRCLLNAGMLDPAFGNGAGYVTTPLSSGNDQVRALLVQPSGNIVAAGVTTIPVTTNTKKGTTTTNVNGFGVASYNPDGSLDTAFGTGGIVRQLFAGNGASNGPWTAALQPTGTTGDSKIVLAGADAAQGGFALMRLNANGTLDTTFGSNGQVITPVRDGSSTASGQFVRALAVTSSGQILALGGDNNFAGPGVLLARYNPNGSLDPTFGNGGTVVTTLPLTSGGVGSLALQPDGKIVLAGGATVSTGSGTVSEGLVVRLSANGSLDTTFGSGGLVTTAPPVIPPSGSASILSFSSVAVYPTTGATTDGMIVAFGTDNVHVIGGGQTENEWAVARYSANGSPDLTFGNGAGSLAIPDPKSASPDDHGNAVAIEPDGKPILVGNASSLSGGGSYSQVARLNVDGSLDATFGNAGLVATSIGSNGGWFYAVAIQPDGKILAAGYAGGNSNLDFSLARYLPSEPEVGSFTASPNPVPSGSSTTLTASNIIDANPGATITKVAFYLDSNGDRKLEPGTDQLVGYATQTSPGVWTFTFTVNLAPGTYTLFAQAQDNDGVFGDPLAVNLQVV